jgi:hypothetical protein
MADRVCTPDMTPFERFQFGDEVAHLINGDGMIVKNNGEEISVMFANGSRGTYDAGWFSRYPSHLIHRGTSEA